MFQALLTAMQRECSGERALDTVRMLARHHRIQASPGYDAAAAELGEAAVAAGLRVEREVVPGDGRTRRLGMVMPEGWDATAATAVLHGRGGGEPLCDFAREPLSL